MPKKTYVNIPLLLLVFESIEYNLHLNFAFIVVLSSHKIGSVFS